MPPDASGRGTLRRRVLFLFRRGWERSRTGFQAGSSAWIGRYSILQYRRLSVVATGWQFHRGTFEWRLNQNSFAPYATPRCTLQKSDDVVRRPGRLQQYDADVYSRQSFYDSRFSKRLSSNFCILLVLAWLTH